MHKMQQNAMIHFSWNKCCLLLLVVVVVGGGGGGGCVKGL